MRTKSLLTTLVIPLVMGPGPGGARRRRPGEYKWTFCQPWVRPLANQAYQFFIDKTKEYTDGRVEIELFVDGLLGNHDETFHGVQDGSITIGTFLALRGLIPAAC
jgi:TRAP-type C4-dicarboxylate transport system substrate-binding protein